MFASISQPPNVLPPLDPGFPEELDQAVVRPEAWSPFDLQDPQSGALGGQRSPQRM